MDRTFKPGDIVQHFKRENVKNDLTMYLYSIIGEAFHTETGEHLMVYKALYAPYKVCARPYDMFMSEVNHEKYPDIKQQYRFELRVPAEEAKSLNLKDKPDEITDKAFRHSSFGNGEVLHSKTKKRLPAMGWNSWNAFGSGNTEALTKIMADKIVELGLDKLGYKYVILDDGCYKASRVNGHLSNEEVKFPSGFKALGDYIHSKGLKFGMYNDIGTNLCAGAEVGTCGFEAIDSRDYIDWGVDFIKVDNCYYLWDNATFSNPESAKYTYAPLIRGISLTSAKGDSGTACSSNEENTVIVLSAANDSKVIGRGVVIKEDGAENIGTFDGTGPDAAPNLAQSGELWFEVAVNESGEYLMTVDSECGAEPGKGSWLQAACGADEDEDIVFDDFYNGEKIKLVLTKGTNVIRLMNHRRQENTLCSYAALLEGFNKYQPDNDIVLSICEWGKTQPQNWGYKVGDSWRILNDITFRVGSDGDPGYGAWESDYTTGITSQYNKAVIMDEFSGLDKGWNDPDMLMIGMNDLTEEMNRTHMVMWSMMNSPLMLGLDLRRVEKGDAIYNIIANPNVIALNQDKLGIQAKRVFTSIEGAQPDDYIRDNNRVDILAKPLADGTIAISVINLAKEAFEGEIKIRFNNIALSMLKKLDGSLTKHATACERQAIEEAKLGINKILSSDSFAVSEIWTGKSTTVNADHMIINSLNGCEAYTFVLNVK